MEALNLSKGFTHYNHSSEGIVSWMDGLQDYRLFVMGFIFMVQGNIIAPATVLTVLHFGLPSSYLLICTLGFFAILVSNLASEKVRYSIPIFIVSTLSNILLVIYAVMAN